MIELNINDTSRVGGITAEWDNFWDYCDNLHPEIRGWDEFLKSEIKKYNGYLKLDIKGGLYTHIKFKHQEDMMRFILEWS